MTACSNSRRHGAVVAALVGAMSLGAPAVALAANGGVDMMAASWATGAKVSAATDGKGNVLSGDLSAKTFETGKGKYLKPTQLTGDYGTVSIDDGYKVEYFASTNTSSAAATAVAGNYSAVDTYFATASDGLYYVKVSKGSDETALFPFRLADSTSETVVSVKGTVTYSGAELRYGIEFVDQDGNDLGTDKNGVTITKITNLVGTAQHGTIKNAGSYLLTVKYNGEDYQVPLTVEKLDLAKATLSVPDSGTAYANANAVLAALEADGVSVASATEIGVTGVLSPNKTASYNDGEGAYTVTLSAADNQDNVVNSGSVTYYVLDKDVFTDGATISYDGDDITASKALSVNLAKGESFDASKLSVKYNGKTYSGSALEVTYSEDGETAEIDPSELSKKGVYDVHVRLVPVNDFEKGYIGGTVKVDLTVSGNEVVANDGVAFFLDGELSGNAGAITYDGTDQLEKVSVTVKDGSKTLVEGTDYTLEVKKGGKVVTEAVDADTYEIAVKPITFTLDTPADAVFELTVEKVKLGLAGVEMKDFLYDDGTVAGRTYVNEAVAWTGSAVEVPGAQHPVLNEGQTAAKDSPVKYAALDPSLYNVVSIKTDGGETVKEAVDADTYKVKIALTDEAAKNYELNDDEFTFMVHKYQPFSDVSADAWYAQVLETAKHNSYVKGVSGTDLFMPEATISRADAVCILFNMAGAKWQDEDFSYDENGGYVTGFDDVQGNEYFARALAWAHAMGIANGSDGQFRPYDLISREEFAALMANYAKAKGDYVAPSAGAMDGISDADGVSGWASEVVAWAVENGVMGNKGYVYAPSTITRAEVAAMAVNYQPEAL